MPSRPTAKTLTLTAATAASTGWIPIDAFVSDVQVGFEVEKAGAGVAPVINIEGTLQNVLASGSVASTRVFEMASAAAASATGIRAVGALTFIANAVRLSTISGGSGASTLTFGVLQSGPK